VKLPHVGGNSGGGGDKDKDKDKGGGAGEDGDGEADGGKGESSPAPVPSAPGGAGKRLPPHGPAGLAPLATPKAAGAPPAPSSSASAPPTLAQLALGFELLQAMGTELVVQAAQLHRWHAGSACRLLPVGGKRLGAGGGGQKAGGGGGGAEGTVSERV
jgi:hypothetical protein